MLKNTFPLTAILTAVKNLKGVSQEKSRLHGLEKKRYSINGKFKLYINSGYSLELGIIHF